MSLTLGLNTALSGLLTAQRGLDVISQNVVNVNTEGYVRKVMNPESRIVSGTGAGVQDGGVSRMVNEGLLKDIRRQNTATGALDVEQTYYPRIDDLFGEVADNSSIAHKLATLTSSFETLATSVNKPAIQWATVQSAQDVADQLSSMTDSLQNLRVEADRDIETTVTEINTLVSDIHDLNQKIVKNSAIATGTSDLEDKRDLALSNLAKLVDIQYYYRTDNAVTIYSTSGQMLLDNQPQALTYSASAVTESWMSAAGGQYDDITIEGGTTDFGPQVKGGKLYALLQMRDKTIPDLQANLDEVSQQMTTTLNQVHNRGTSLPNVSYYYQGTRAFAKQGDVVPAAGVNSATFYQGTATAITNAGGGSGGGGYGTLSFSANTTNPWQINLSATASTFDSTAYAIGKTFSIAGITGTPDSRNNGTYKVVGYTDDQNIVVEKVNVRQTVQLDGTDDVVIATFDKDGNQLQQTTLNEIMQLDFTSAPNAPATPYTATTIGSGRSLADLDAKGDHDQWAINEVSAHVEAWLRKQGYENASVNLDSNGKMVVDMGQTDTSLAFRDQTTSDPGDDAEDATIKFDVNGDGISDETVQGFSNFFGLNDLYVNTKAASFQDSTILPDTFKLSANRDLQLFDSTGKLGNTIVLAKGSTLQQIADTINTQSRTNESAALSASEWTLDTPATISVSDSSGTLFSMNLLAGAHSLDELAGKMSQGTVTASVVQDGSNSRLRLVDARGHALTVSISGGDISGSTLNLGQTLDMTPTQRIQASVVPEGSGYRLRLRQTTGDTLYTSSSLDGQSKNLLSELSLDRAATGAADGIKVRTDLLGAPEKISRGQVQWNGDIKRYYISEGDNSSALALADATESKLSFNSAGGIYAGKYSLSEYAASSIGVVAQMSSSSKSRLEYQTTLNNSLEFQNTSFSGVNLDEEISSMMDFQQAYTASARVITTLQDMLETLTSMIR